jgi:methylated-DNA-[protein]-cysteine S-methyltransferase
MGEVIVWRAFEAGEERPLILVTGDSGALEEIRFEGIPPAGAAEDRENAVLREAAEQLSAYFAGDLKEFDLPLAPRGTNFQQCVWSALRTIPYGQTRSYSQMAEAIGAPKSVRAVGAANGRNPIPIVIPCHRVIGASGKLVGFGGGLPLKRKLLDLESAQTSFTAKK